MSIRVINHSPLEMSDDEYALYQKIVKENTNSTQKGSDLFFDLWEADTRGIIMFLKPPSQRRTTFQIIIFLMMLQQQQHIRLMYDQVADIAKQMKDKIAEIDSKLVQLK